MTESPLKVAIYVRVSTEKQDLDNQLLVLKPFCKAKRWEIYEIYADIMTGSEDKRPAFDRLFEDAHKMKFDVFLFWALDRFSRSGTLFTIQKLKELDNLGIGWHSYQEPYLSTLGPYGDMVISILACLAKAERERISERTKAGLARAKAAGKKIGPGCRTYNFKKIWEEFKREKSIYRTAKLLPYGHGTVHFIIKNDIHDQKTYEEMRAAEWERRKAKKGLSNRGGC